MKSMALAVISLIICGGTFYIRLVNSLTIEQFGALEAGWKKFLCEDEDRSLLEEMLGCSPLMTEEMSAVYAECRQAGLPGNTNSAEFLKVGCNDPKVFEIYSTCIELHKEKEGFLEKLEKNSGAYECYIGAMKKRGFNWDD